MSGAARSGDRISPSIVFIWALAAVLSVLKLTGALDWSWWVVMSPLWLTYGVGVLVFFVALVVVAVKSDLPKHPRRF